MENMNEKKLQLAREDDARQRVQQREHIHGNESDKEANSQQQSEADARKELDRTRIAAQRKQETQSQIDTRKELDRTRRAAKRKQETHSQVDARRELERTRITAKRKQETHSQVEARRELDRTRKAAERKQETHSQVDARKELDRTRKAAERKQETHSQVEARRELDRTRKAAKRKQETESQVIARRDLDRRRRALQCQQQRMTEYPSYTASTSDLQSQSDIPIQEEIHEYTTSIVGGETLLDIPEDEHERTTELSEISNSQAHRVQPENSDNTEMLESDQLIMGVIQQEIRTETSLHFENVHMEQNSSFENIDVTVDNNRFCESNLNPHTCGPMDIVCQSCEAKHFSSECPSDGKFNNCCHKGKVKPPQYREPPTFIRDLMSNPKNRYHKHFQNNIRSYNSAISFASMGAEISNPFGQGPYCFRVHGQIYHRTCNIHPTEGESRQFAQLYVVDSKMATEIRLQNRCNERCNREIMEQLDQIIRNYNVYAKAYKMLGEIEREENQHAAADPSIPNRTVNMVFTRDRNSDRRRYNMPNVDEVAMIFRNTDGEPPFDRDFRVYPRNQGVNFINLNILSPNLDPMTYTLFFPYGEPGWQPGMNINTNLSNNNSRKNISMLQYKVSLTAVRDNYNSLLHGGKLFQQWVVDSYLQVQANNLNFIRNRQKDFKVEQYQGLSDYLATVATEAGTHVGRKIILPSSFQGSPRNMRERYQDAMAIVGKFGKPDLFITMTCNPSWNEIKDNLYPAQQASDRPDIVARVFKLKLAELLKDILQKNIFGCVTAYCYSIEFQKRGLPHVHILIILSDEDKFFNPTEVDKVVCAEIPDPNLEPTLYNIIKNCMVHGPCGSFNPNAPCMDNNICSKGFPKEFRSQTQIGSDGYPLYRRRPNIFLQLDKHRIDNRYIVPYNKHLSFKFNCHINVEVCSSLNSIKYIFKYIYKGYDCINVQMAEDIDGRGIIHDEISQFINARYISAPEGMWRLLENKMHDKSHSVIRLPVHLERQQNIYFAEGEERKALESANRKNTQLTAWFILNQHDDQANNLFYSSIPYNYIFDKNTTLWKPRTRRANKIIPRMYYVNFKDIERYHLKLLLLHVRGAVSFESLRTVDGVVYPTFKEAALRRHLIIDDNEWISCMTEAAFFQFPSQIRHLFALICSFNRPKCPQQLYEQFEDKMIEDFIYQGHTFEIARNKCLTDIENVLSMHSMKCSTLGLPDPASCSQALSHQQEVLEPLALEARLNSLNMNQKEIFDSIINAVYDEMADHRFFFIDGPAGAGKTYLYNTLISYLIHRGRIVLPFATTGIAADLLGGRTVHSGFRLPVPILDTSTSSMKIPSNESNTILHASLLIIDEVSMLSSNALRIINMLLKDIMMNDRLFGGKIIVLGGDFRQTANVIPRGSNADIIEACIKQSPLWRYVQKFNLTVNMRAAGQDEFCSWLLKVGDGTLHNDAIKDLTIIEIPADMFIKGDITTEIYGDSINVTSDDAIKDLSTKIILTTKNKDALQLNNDLLDLIQGDATTYLSVDSHITDDDDECALNFTIEFLNQQFISGLPPHKLKLKKGSIIMLLRNLNPRDGLLNGTRLVIKSLHNLYIHAQILTGRNTNNEVLIPRIDLIPSDTTLPFRMKRRQFPIIPALAMTINKSQGQSFNKVGLFLPKPVFSHGQLYVALSRTRDKNNLKVHIENCQDQGELLESRYFTKNIVIRDLLE